MTGRHIRLGQRVRRARRMGGGFTLLETSMALVIIGVGVLAFVEAQKSFIQNNNWSSRAATATFLANEIREMTKRFSRHDPVTGLSITGTGSSAVITGWGTESGELSVDDYNDLDDLDGKTFGLDGETDGPVNAFGEIIPAIDASGNAVTDNNGNPVALTEWSQTISVEKVDPLNFATTRAKTYFVAANGTDPGTSVDQFPLRVTVVIRHQGPLDAQAEEVARVTWVVPP
ncbi:MAG: prepilin-type N-terminal cleavage/methylation domain-containing protein [Planctomycetota bacterium]|nr:prepilin-type N-terminal cleavage/methylation domain-containing protein [Planctomycetota bacterium]